MSELLHLLVYEYVEDMTERRAPHREAHLELIRRYADDGKLVIAGGIGVPSTVACSPSATPSTPRRSLPRTPTPPPG